MSGHEDREHRKYSASKADRIALCPGSVNLLERVPARPTSRWAIEGTRAHTVLQAALDNRVRDAKTAHEDYSELCMEQLDDRHGGNYNLFYHSINVMLNRVYEVLDEFPDAVMWCEIFVDPPSTVAPGEVGGFLDVAIYVPSTQRLFVFDYKHGAGVTKAVMGNRQVMQYTAGLLYGEDALVPEDIETITLTIVQPRAFHADGEIRSYDVTPWDVQNYLFEMDDAIAASQKLDAPLIPGEEQCQFCDAKVECPARQALALSGAHSDFRTVRDVLPGKLKALELLTPEDFAWGSEAFPLLEKYIKEFYERRNELMHEGYVIPGKKLVETNPIRKWYGTEKALAERLSALIGCPQAELFSTKFVTITEAEKRVVEAYRKTAGPRKRNDAAEAARKAMALLTIKESRGGFTLVNSEDPRPSVIAGAANFTQIAGMLPGTGE